MTTDTIIDPTGARGEVETAFSVRRPAWGGGAVLEGSPQTAAEAIRQAGLDWEVVKVPAFRATLDGKYQKQIPDKFAMVRTSDDSTLGVVGKNYHPFQNGQAFDFLDDLVHGGEIEYETAGALYGGRKVWVMCKVPHTIEITGGDKLQPYIFVAASHDGSSAVTAATTATRIECANTFSIAVGGAKNKYTFRHTDKGAIKLQEARETLKLQLTWDEALQVELSKMVETQVTDEQFAKIMTKNFPDAKLQTPKSIAAVLENRRVSPTIQDEYRPTAWGALNSFSEYTEHMRPYRSQEAREKAVLVGWQQKMVSDVSRDLRDLAVTG